MSLNGDTHNPGISGSSASQRWQEILAQFVDDPPAAVNEATELVEDEVIAYIALLSGCKDSPTEGPGTDRRAQTEELRIALLACRDLSRLVAAASIRALC